MKYKILKGMLESFVKVYKCPMCNTEINENDVDIVGAAGNTLNINIECNKCKKSSMIKAEINNINLFPLNMNQEQINGISNKGERITDTEITDLNKKLKNSKLNASDLFEN
ncbi:MAG: hypothetical protein PHN31_03855 [Candidatus Gracilibacteria bacterium]|nr:hypothetical protein [Candidatus Gracilibacteria bacterium]